MLKTISTTVFAVLISAFAFAQDVTEALVIGVIPIGSQEVVTFEDQVNKDRYKSELVRSGLFQVGNKVDLEAITGRENKYKVHKSNLGQTIFASKYYVNSGYEIHPLREDFLIRVNTEMSRTDLYFQYTPEQRYILWNDKLNQVVSTAEFHNFTTQQKSYVVRHKEKLTVETFEFDSREQQMMKNYIRAQRKIGAKVFDVEILNAIFGTLDDFTDPGSRIPNADKDCDCNLGSIIAITCESDKCQQKAGCGVFWLWTCDGVKFRNAPAH